jgi:hypothetical protein
MMDSKTAEYIRDIAQIFNNTQYRDSRSIADVIKTGGSHKIVVVCAHNFLVPGVSFSIFGNNPTGNWVIVGDNEKAVTGHNGISESGNYGKSISGNKGMSISGEGGVMASGDNGMLISRKGRKNVATAYVGKNGIEPNVAYKLDDKGNFVKA